MDDREGQTPNIFFTLARRNVSAGAARRTVGPALHLLDGDHVLARWRPDLNLESSSGPETLDPAILLQPGESQTGRFVQRFRFDINVM
jgi:hypothetical protein